MAANKYEKAMEQAGVVSAKLPEREPPTNVVESPRHTVGKGVGRPPGKRSNPDWEQVTVYIRKETKRAALRRLLDEQSTQDLSELLDQLLARWAKPQL